MERNLRDRIWQRPLDVDLDRSSWAVYAGKEGRRKREEQARLSGIGAFSWHLVPVPVSASRRSRGQELCAANGTADGLLQCSGFGQREPCRKFIVIAAWRHRPALGRTMASR